MSWQVRTARLAPRCAVRPCCSRKSNSKSLDGPHRSAVMARSPGSMCLVLPSSEPRRVGPPSRMRCRGARRVCVALIGVLLGVSSPVQGQGGASQAGRFVCFRIHPLPECRSYWIVEVQGVFPVASSAQGYRYVVGDPENQRDVFEDNNLEINLGYMLNATPSVSLGAALAVGSGSGGVPDGARARLRWWATRVASVEIEAGMVRTNLGSWIGSPVTGPSAGARLNYRDIGSVLVRFDRIRIPADELWSGGAASGISVGASASSGGALVTGALIGLGLIVLVLIAPAS